MAHAISFFLLQPTKIIIKRQFDRFEKSNYNKILTNLLIEKFVLDLFQYSYVF